MIHVHPKHLTSKHRNHLAKLETEGPHPAGEKSHSVVSALSRLAVGEDVAMLCE